MNTHTPRFVRELEVEMGGAWGGPPSPCPGSVRGAAGEGKGREGVGRSFFVSGAAALSRDARGWGGLIEGNPPAPSILRAQIPNPAPPYPWLE